MLNLQFVLCAASINHVCIYSKLACLLKLNKMQVTSSQVMLPNRVINLSGLADWKCINKLCVFLLNLNRHISCWLVLFVCFYSILATKLSSVRGSISSFSQPINQSTYHKHYVWPTWCSRACVHILTRSNRPTTQTLRSVWRHEAIVVCCRTRGSSQSLIADVCRQ